MTDKYEAPFEGGKTPKKNPGVVAGASRPVGSSRAAHLARLALKKAASKPVKEEACGTKDYPLLKPGKNLKPMKLKEEEIEQVEEGYMKKTVSDDDSGMSDYEHHMQTRDPKTGLTGRQIQQRKAMDAADFKKRREEMNANRQAGTKPLSTTYKEEVELDEAKDNREYDYEGDMAMSQLKSVITNAQKLHDMLDPDTNLPEWVQSKITLAEDYIVTAANYMDGEMNEDAQQDYAHTSAVAADKKRRAASDFADKGFKNPVLSPAQRERRQELSRAATSTSDMESAKFLNPKRPVGSHPDRVIRGLNKDTEQARIGMRALTAKVRAEKKPNLPEEVEQVEEGLVGDLARAYFKPKVKAAASRLTTRVARKFGATPQNQRRFAVAASKWAVKKLGEDVEQIDELTKKFLVSPPGDDGKGGYGSKAIRAHLAAKASGDTATADKRARGYNLAQAKAFPGQYVKSPNKAKVPATNEEIEQVEEEKNRQVEPPPEAMPSDTRIKPLPKKGKRTVGSFNKFGNFTPGMREDVEQIEEKKMGYEKLPSAIKARVDRKKLSVEAHDPVGKEDADINNDGKTDKTDVYLHTKRRAIGKAISARLAAKAGK